MRASGAPGRIAATGSITTSSGSYSTSTADTPSSAAASVSASTIATGWPLQSTSFDASGDCARELASGFDTPSVWLVYTAFTPGTSTAADISILTIRA